MIIDHSSAKEADWLSDRLTEMSRANLTTHSHSCPHCGNLMRYPTIARQQDIDDFKKIMDVAYTVMNRHGITANLLADMQTELHIRIARLKAKKD